MATTNLTAGQPPVQRDAIFRFLQPRITDLGMHFISENVKMLDYKLQFFQIDQQRRSLHKDTLS